MLRRVLPILLLLVSHLAWAADAHQSLDAVVEAANNFVAQQLAPYGDKATFQLGRLNGRLTLPPCSKLEAMLANGNRLVGNTSVQVKCMKGANWSVNIPVAVTIQAQYWVATRPLAPNHEINETDIEQRSGDLSQLPPTVVMDYAAAVGHTLLSGVPAGGPLRTDQLRPPFVVKQNEFVKVLAHGEGFEVASEGKALGNANTGQTVSVKMASGAIVQGTAREDGSVDIRY